MPISWDWGFQSIPFNAVPFLLKNVAWNGPPWKFRLFEPNCGWCKGNNFLAVFFGLNPFTLRSLFWSFPWSLVCSFRSTLVLHDWWWKFTVPACRVNGGWWRFVVYCSQIFGSPLCPLPFLDLWMYVASTFEVVLWSFGNPLLVPTGHITHEHQTYRFKHRGEKSPPKQHWFISWAACMWLAKSMPVWSLKIFRVRVVI